MNIITLENYLGKAGIQMASSQVGVVLLFLQRKVLVTHYLNTMTKKCSKLQTPNNYSSSSSKNLKM
jgi:hypothetical protein